MQHKYTLTTRKSGRAWLRVSTHDIFQSLPRLKEHGDALSEMASAVSVIEGEGKAPDTLTSARVRICERWVAIRRTLHPNVMYTLNELNDLLDDRAQLEFEQLIAYLDVRLATAGMYNSKLQRKEVSCGIQPKKTRKMRRR